MIVMWQIFPVTAENFSNDGKIITNAHTKWHILGLKINNDNQG